MKNSRYIYIYQVSIYKKDAKYKCLNLRLILGMWSKDLI